MALVEEKKEKKARTPTEDRGNSTGTISPSLMTWTGMGTLVRVCCSSSSAVTAPSSVLTLKCRNEGRPPASRFCREYMFVEAEEELLVK